MQNLKNTEKAKEVNAIISNEKFEKKVLIATSFLDVGINLKDDALRNIVIIAQIKHTFFSQLEEKGNRISRRLVYIYIYQPLMILTARLKKRVLKK